MGNGYGMLIPVEVSVNLLVSRRSIQLGCRTEQVIEHRSNKIHVMDEVRRRHLERGEAWLRRDAEGFLSYFWEDVEIFGMGERTNLLGIRSWLLPILQSGGGPLTMTLPPADNIVVSALRDAATTSYEWSQRFKAEDGTESDRKYHEMNVWYQRNEIWRIIRMYWTIL